MPKLLKVEIFDKGLITSIEARAISRGAYSDMKNFVTKGDKVEIRRGTLLYGTEIAGLAKANVHTAYKADGTAVLFRKRGRKIEYYDTVTSDWIEVGADIIPVAAADEDVFFANYQSLAGAQVFFGGPNSSLYKIMVANPGSYVDVYDSSINFKGFILIKQNRMFLWGRKEDKTAPYLSHIDAMGYTTVTAEATTSLTGTLAFKAGGAKRTCFAVQITITATGEVYTDDYNGVLTGSLGGTGTINYMSGAYTLSNAGVGTANYQWEDSNVNGITDFTYSGVRVASEGVSFRQDDGGAIMNIYSYKDTEYCIHETKTWALTLTADDTNATNVVFRDKVGMTSKKAGVATGAGVFVVNDSDQKDPRVELLSYSIYTDEVVPRSISPKLNLSNYRFDNAVLFEWGDFILLECRHKDWVYNNTLFIYDKIWKSWDKHEHWVNDFANYNGLLMIGDSISSNVYNLYTGLDDDESIIDAWVTMKTDDLDIDRLKKVKKLRIGGEIGVDQSIKVFVETDNGGFVEIGTIAGDETYVDRAQRVYVGALTLGIAEVGGGGLEGDIPAYNYLTEIDFNQDKFQDVKVKFVPQKIGYFSVSEYDFMDIRQKQMKMPKKYR